MSNAEKHNEAACAANKSPAPCSDGLIGEQLLQRGSAPNTRSSDAAVKRKRYLLMMLVACGMTYLIAFPIFLWWVFVKVPADTARADMNTAMTPALPARDRTETVEVITTKTDAGITTAQDSSSPEAAPDPVTSIITSITTETSESVATSTSTVNEETTTLFFTTTEVVNHTKTITKNVSTKTVHPATTTIHPSVVTTSMVLTLTTTKTNRASVNARDRRTLPPEVPETATETASSGSTYPYASTLLPKHEDPSSGDEETRSHSLGPSTSAFDKRALTYTWMTVTSTRHRRTTRHRTKTTSQTMTMTNVLPSTTTTYTATAWAFVTVDPNGKTLKSSSSKPSPTSSSKKSEPPKESPKKPDPPKPAPPPPPPPPLADPKAANCPAIQNKLRLSTKFCALVPAGNDEGTESTKDCGDFCHKALTEACDFCWTGRKDDFGGLNYNPHYGGVGMEYGHTHTWMCCNNHCKCATTCYDKGKLLQDNPPRNPGDVDEKCV